MNFDSHMQKYAKKKQKQLLNLVMKPNPGDK